VTLSALAKTLKNPFYAGLIRIFRNGQTFKGNHEPLISVDRFENVQNVLAGKRVDRPTIHGFLYSRLVRCASCGYSLIGEKKKGRVYYRCHDRPFKNPPSCSPTSIREDNLDYEISKRFASLELSDGEIEAARSFIAASRQEAFANRAAATKALRLQLDRAQDRMTKLADLLIDGTVDKDLFEEKKKIILFEQARVRHMLAEAERGESSALDQLEKAVELSKSPSTLYKHASDEKKRELLKTMLSNFSVAGKNVSITLALPFRIIAEGQQQYGDSPDGGAQRGTCRTWEHILQKLITHLNTKARSAEAA